MMLSVENGHLHFPHPVGMRLSVSREASLRDAMCFFVRFSTERFIPDGMKLRLFCFDAVRLVRMRQRANMQKAFSLLREADMIFLNML